MPTQAPLTPLLTTQRIVQVCLLLMSFIAIFGGTVQMILGEPETTPRLDNIHRFMAGVYLTTGFTALWAALTIRQHDKLVYFLALAAFLGGTGRVISIINVGMPEPFGLWLGYLIPELMLPIVIVVAHVITQRRVKKL